MPGPCRLATHTDALLGRCRAAATALRRLALLLLLLLHLPCPNLSPRQIVHVDRLLLEMPPGALNVATELSWLVRSLCGGGNRGAGGAFHAPGWEAPRQGGGSGGGGRGGRNAGEGSGTMAAAGTRATWQRGFQVAGGAVASCHVARLGAVAEVEQVVAELAFYQAIFIRLFLCRGKITSLLYRGSTNFLRKVSVRR